MHNEISDLDNLFVLLMKDNDLFSVIIEKAQDYNIEEVIPIPTFIQREDIICCCERIFFGSYDAYIQPKEKACMLLIRIIQGHYLPNGNKRIACFIFLLFVKIYQINQIDDITLMDIAREIASTPAIEEKKLYTNTLNRLFS